MSDDDQRLGLGEITEQSAFVRLLETKARVKMLDVLMRHSYAALSQSQIADRANLDQTTVSRNIDVFEDLGVVEVEDGWPTEYQIDRDSAVVRGLEQAQTALLEHSERLVEDDVRQLEDCREWTPVAELSEEELQTLGPVSGPGESVLHANDPDSAVATNV